MMFGVESVLLNGTMVKHNAFEFLGYPEGAFARRNEWVRPTYC